MKTTFKFIIAVMAAVSVFASCQKEMSIETANNTNDAVRVISAQFDNSTKSTLDGFTPKFTNGDLIKVANGEDTPETLTVSVDGSGNATFTTTLTGTLTAVYPADAAKLNGNAIEGVLVKTVQDGTFANANIAMATITAESSSATFQGQTAVFRITPGAGANTKYVEVITAGPAIANTTTTEYTKKNKIRVATTTTTAADEVFVSVLVPTGLKLRDLSFADGSNIKTVIDATKGATLITANTIYTITSSDWDEPYVEINGLKWATMNLGATTVAGSYATCAGDYYAWGETEPYYDGTLTWSGTTGTFPSWKTNKTGGYVWPSYCGQESFAEWSTPPYDGTPEILKAEYDAATINWEAGWRMPTSTEFQALYEACGKTGESCSPSPNGTSTTTAKGIYWCSSYNGVAGLLFIVKDNGTHLFFPAAGGGITNTLINAVSIGDYWSSSLNSGDTVRAYFLRFGSDNVSPQSEDFRCFGFSVRPVSD